jgi:hypothetical protein
MHLVYAEQVLRHVVKGEYRHHITGPDHSNRSSTSHSTNNVAPMTGCTCATNQITSMIIMPLGIKRKPPAKRLRADRIVIAKLLFILLSLDTGGCSLSGLKRDHQAIM